MILKDFMKANELTPEQVAKQTGMALSTVYRHLAGVRKVSGQAAVKYSRLGINLEELLLESQATEPTDEPAQAANG